MTGKERNELNCKLDFCEWAIEKLYDYLFDPTAKRAVVHMEFENEAGERQEKTRWYVKDGFRRDGTAGEEELKTLQEVMGWKYYDSYLDNPDRINHSTI